ncbi:alpha/beta fold hydrolase [Arthrobacter sp. M4]|uniref:thioesterase II family protein n=1 Tax=Arthrobacter sp. M4 TaxID=218160 RepID=UPI001CDCB9B9|nr:alpha/beta fold hydrolase [Arthrobacter sp. M4]MCA4135048.1 hypothetical protein [Arthrobacter sp. M4]
MHLFCLHHAGGTTASFASWRFPSISVTKLGYRGRDFESLSHAADLLAETVEASPSPRLAVYGHSLGALLAFEVALRLQAAGRMAHVFLAAARPPLERYDGDAAATAAAMAPGVMAAAAAEAGGLSARAAEILAEDLALLSTYPGRPPSGQLSVPATIAYSADDPVVPPAECLRWAEWCRDEPRHLEVPGDGHLFHRGNPLLLNAVEATLSPGRVDGFS